MTMMKINTTVPLAFITFFLAASISVAASAQQTPYVVGSTVTGHVFCADTNAPARFAKVLLKSTEGSHGGEEFLKRLTDNLEKMVGKEAETAPPVKLKTPGTPFAADKKQAMDAATKGMNQALEMMNATTVGLNGEFKFAGVKP